MTAREFKHLQDAEAHRTVGMAIIDRGGSMDEAARHLAKAADAYAEFASCIHARLRGAKP